MPTDKREIKRLLRRLVDADVDAECTALVARGASQATTLDRQLAAIAAAHLAGDTERLDALVRDHLADHPESILAAWIAAEHTTPHSATTSAP